MRIILKAQAGFTRYKYPFNINREESATYLKKVSRAEQALNQFEEEQKVPRRKRRVYDRPRIDRDISDYGAWRIFEEEEKIPKINEHAMQVVAKVNLSPRWLVHAFGMGAIPTANPRSSHREYNFEDNRLNRFLLYEYRNTTAFRENKESYDYDNQEHLHPRLRVKERMQPKEFWKSQNEFEFRINATIYAEHHKFIEWLLRQVSTKKNQSKSYDDYIDEKFGKVLTFNKKEDMEFFEPNKPMVTNVTPEHFNFQKKGKQTPASTYKCGKILDEKYRVDQAEEQRKRESSE